MTMKENTGVTKSNRKPAAVQSIYRAASILSCISNGVISMTEIATACNLSTSTVHRILQALQDSNLVIYDSIARKYYLGGLITKLLATIQIPHSYLVNLAKEPISRLASETGETISLAMMIGQQYNVLYEIPSKHRLRVVESGTSVIMDPALATGASGMALLSQLGDRELELRVLNIEISGKMDNRDDYIRHVKQIRKQGYAISNERVVPETMCISAPVLKHLLPTVLSIYGPKIRMKPKVEIYKRLLLHEVSLISQHLGKIIKAKIA